MSHTKIKNPLRYRRSQATKLNPQFRNIDKTLALLEKEECELKTKLKLHTNLSSKMQLDRDNTVLEIERRLDCEDKIRKEIEAKKRGIEHLKLGIKQVDAKSLEIAAGAISDFQYHHNLNKAKRIKENLESRLTALKRMECTVIAENTRLNEMIDKLLTDRQLFCNIWIKLDKELSENKELLLEKTDKLAITFNENDYLRAEIKSINEKARRFEAMHLAEARNMVRKAVVDENSLKFLAVKRNKRLTGSEANKLSTLVTNTRESNTQINLQSLSLAKEIKEIFKKINAIFQVLSLEDRLDDFNINKKKEIEYEMTKSLGVLDVQLNIELNNYIALKNPDAMKHVKKQSHNSSGKGVKQVETVKAAKKNKDFVTPVDVEELRKERSNVLLSKQTESGHLVGISKVDHHV